MNLPYDYVECFDASGDEFPLLVCEVEGCDWRQGSWWGGAEEWDREWCLHATEAHPEFAC